jgi:hypothetical protein
MVASLVVPLMLLANVLGAEGDQVSIPPGWAIPPQPPPSAPSPSTPPSAPAPAAPAPPPQVLAPPHLAPPPVPAPVVPIAGYTTRWYGWELLLADAASLVVLGNGKDAAALTYLGGAGLVLAAPALHLANGNVGKAIASVAVRGGVTLVAMSLLTSESRPCPMPAAIDCTVQRTGDTFADVFLAAGLILGGAIFAVVDDTLLATSIVPATPAPTPTASRGRRLRTTSVSTFIGPSRGGLSLGLTGAF